MIEIRNHNDYVKQAALKGITLDFKHVKKQFQEISEEQKAMMAGVVKAAAERKIKEKADLARKKNGNK